MPIVVANDGDVSALAGAMSLGAGCVMGLAMGTGARRQVMSTVKAICSAGSVSWRLRPLTLNEHAMRDE